MGLNSGNKCYWCSEPSTGVEHIPPKGLFPKGHRKNLITVNSCTKHNQDFSKIDERMKIHMTSMGGESKLAKKFFETETIRGLRRIESRGLAIDIVKSKITTSDGTILMRVDADKFKVYFEKINK